MKSAFPYPIRQILQWYVVSLCFFTGFRILLLFSQWKQLSAIDENALWLTLQAFWMGWRFDTVILCYVLALPYVVLWICAMLKLQTPIITMVLKWIVGIIVMLVLLICAADIPFFNYHFTRINATAFAWMDSPKFVFSMIFGEWRFAIFGGVFVVICALFIWIFSKHRLPVYPLRKYPAKILQIVAMLVFAGLIFLGMRGRWEQKSPIRVGTAYFCNNPFLNQLGLNPAFTLMRSMLDQSQGKNQHISLCDPAEALAWAKVELGADNTIHDEKFPLSRWEFPSDTTSSPALKNIVIVLMESMTANYLQRFGNPKNLTPFLDSLAHNSLFFINFTTAGIHTHNGIFSSLFSYPAPMAKTSMNVQPIPILKSMSHVLKEKGYQNFYFTTHDDQFDNVGGYLNNNNFDRVISQKHYPAREVKTKSLGVPDHFMFEYATHFLSDACLNRKPFFATFLTSSNHSPIYIPDNIPFKPKYTEALDAIVEYSDWSLRRFIEIASQEPWFNETMFVFLADHGNTLETTYELPYSYVFFPL